MTPWRRGTTSAKKSNVASFTLDAPSVYDVVKADYDLIRSIIVERGFEHLSGRFGQLIQARTKDTGHGST